MVDGQSTSSCDGDDVWLGLVSALLITVVPRDKSVRVHDNERSVRVGITCINGRGREEGVEYGGRVIGRGIMVKQ